MKEPKTKAYFELSQWDETIRITLDYHVITIDEAFETFKRLLLAAGYSEESINEYLES